MTGLKRVQLSKLRPKTWPVENNFSWVKAKGDFRSYGMSIFGQMGKDGQRWAWCLSEKVKNLAATSTQLGQNCSMSEYGLVP